MPAAAEIERHEILKRWVVTLAGERKALLPDHILAGDPKIADVAPHERRDDVVAHEENTEQEIFPEAGELIAAAAVLEHATAEQPADL